MRIFIYSFLKMKFHISEILIVVKIIFQMFFHKEKFINGPYFLLIQFSIYIRILLT